MKSYEEKNKQTKKTKRESETKKQQWIIWKDVTVGFFVVFFEKEIKKKQGKHRVLRKLKFLKQSLLL